ncbi:MAG: radical SAM protein [Candidatus Aminicenantes bacterium]|jgi:radical SAM protein with 4Fe4S-binding SPASM domain
MKRQSLKENINPWETWSNRINELAKKHPLRILFWQTTLNCDSSCKYCSSPKESWEHDKELTTDEIISALNKIKEKFDIKEIIQLSFTGGEPLLRKDITIVAQQAKKLGFKNIAIQTNGRLAIKRSEIVEKLINIGVHIWGVNLDGPKSVHNSLRSTGEWFDDAYRFAQKICNDKRINSTITTLVSKKNLKVINDTYKMIYNLRPHTWRIAHFDPIGRGLKNRKEYYLEKSDMKYLLSFLKKVRIENIAKSVFLNVEFACGGWLGKEWEGIVRPYIFHCVSGIDTMTILYDGSITGCPVVSRKFIQGNIRTDNIHEIWENKFEIFRNFNLRAKGKCLKCSDWLFCHGGPMHGFEQGGNKDQSLFCLKV